jgi:cyclic pyranopterin phosphate synthase
MNLVIARACSNSCPYCFETAERQDGKEGLISAENVLKLAKWAQDSRLESLSLLGGEPFLHPALGDIVNLFRKVCPSTRLRVLTGGVFKKRLLDNLSPDDVGLVFNINEPRDYKKPKHYDKVISNVETAIRRGFHVVLGFNVWRADFDPGFMPNLAHRFARSSFCWTVANPQRGFPSNVLAPGQFNEIAQRCFAMLQESARLNIEALLDCPLPVCFFKDSELAWVRQYHPVTASLLGFCNPILDITPELDVIRCFALSRLTRLKLTDFQNEWEIRDWFLKHIDPQLLQKGIFSHCGECLHFVKGRCHGGCLAWRDNAVDTEAQPGETSLALSMNDAIESGKPEVALGLYAKANSWLKTDVPTYKAAVAAAKLGQWEQAFRYAAHAQQMTDNPEIIRQIRELMAGIPQGEISISASPPVEKASPPFVSCPGTDSYKGAP